MLSIDTGKSGEETSHKGGVAEYPSTLKQPQHIECYIAKTTTITTTTTTTITTITTRRRRKRMIKCEKDGV